MLILIYEEHSTCFLASCMKRRKTVKVCRGAKGKDILIFFQNINDIHFDIILCYNFFLSTTKHSTFCNKQIYLTDILTQHFEQTLSQITMFPKITGMQNLNAITFDFEHICIKS